MLSSILPSTLSNTLPIALDDTLPIALDDTSCLLDYTLPSKLSRRSQVHYEYAPKYTSKYLLKSMISRTLPNVLNGTLPACLTVRSQASSQDALKHTPEYALRYTPNCTRWYTPSLLDFMLPSTLSRGKTLPISLDYMLPCMFLHARSRDLQSGRRQALGGLRLVAYDGQCLAGRGRRVACGMWRVAGGRQCILAKIMTSVDIVV